MASFSTGQGYLEKRFWKKREERKKRADDVREGLNRTGKEGKTRKTGEGRGCNR